MIGMAIGLLVILTLTGLAQAAPEDWGRPTGLPTIDGWRAAGRRNDVEGWQYGYYPNGYHPYGYPSGYYYGGEGVEISIFGLKIISIGPKAPAVIYPPTR
jgi:hypothetical protein